MNIEMIEFTPEHDLPENGKYLVRTVSTHLCTVSHVQAVCKKVWHNKEQKFVTSVDVSNQQVTHISKNKLQ